MINYFPSFRRYNFKKIFLKLEVMKFDGEPSKYAKFVSTFEQTVGAANLSVNKKLLYLLQHCQGKAKQLIKYCCLLKSQEDLCLNKDLVEDIWVEIKPNNCTKAYVVGGIYFCPVSRVRVQSSVPTFAIIHVNTTTLQQLLSYSI